MKFLKNLTLLRCCFRKWEGKEREEEREGGREEQHIKGSVEKKKDTKKGGDKEDIKNIKRLKERKKEIKK